MRKYDRELSQILHADLHWLDVADRVQYKLGVTSQSTVVCILSLSIYMTDAAFQTRNFKRCRSLAGGSVV